MKILTFGQQYTLRKVMQTDFGAVEFVDLVPSQVADPTPILLVPGWGETLELQRACAHEIFKAGRRVVVFRHAVLITTLKAKTDYPAATEQKVETILALLDKLSLTKVDVISHSEGSICTALAATTQPTQFRSLLLVSPAGLSGKSSSSRIVTGFIFHSLKTQLRGLRRALKLLKAMGQSNDNKKIGIPHRLQSIRHEIAAIVSANIYPALMLARQHGIKVAILAGERDVVFPLRKMTNYLARQASAQEYYGFDLFATKPGGHELHSDAMAVTERALSLLESINKNRWTKP